MSSKIDQTRTPCEGRMKRRHPIDYSYNPVLLTRFPEKDISDKEKFPQYLPMVFIFLMKEGFSR
jgi:hypothetical protein